MKKIVIVSPRQKWGGAIVLHTLCQYLVALGYDARIFYTEIYKVENKKITSYIKYYIKWIKYTIDDYINDKKESYYRPIKNIKRKYLPIVDNKTIVVYPDTVYGNPLHGKMVVRWFLYYDRYKDSPNAYGKNDLFICFREQFNNWQLNPLGRKLYCTYFDLDLYKRTNYSDRKGKCYIIRKGKSRSDLPLSFDGVVIDDLPEEEKVKIFNECDTCISYDTQTAYSGIAAMCGCLSIVVPEEGKTRNNYLKGDDVDYGVAYGYLENEIKYARETAHLIRKRYEQNNKQGIESVKNFVKMCEDFFYEQ